MTQCESLLDYLTRHGSITPNEALSELGIGRLAARILELKERGFGIVTEIIEVATRHGTAKVARYSIGSDGVRADSQSAALPRQPPSFLVSSQSGRCGDEPGRRSFDPAGSIKGNCT
jgi:hypothetical protein